MSPEEIIRESMTKRILRQSLAKRQAAQQGGGALDRLQGAADVLSRSGMPIMGAIARPKETAQMLAEGVGAAGGAALGTMAGGVPGAMVGGAAGGALGRTASDLLFDQELPTSGEVTGAALAGAAGPALGPVFRHTARIFGKLPTVQAAIRSAEVAAERARRATVGQQAENVILRAAGTVDEELAQRATALAKARKGQSTGIEGIDKMQEKFIDDPATLARRLDIMEKALADFAEAVPKGVVKSLTGPEQAVARGAAAVPVPAALPGAIPGALGALAGGAYPGMEGATLAGAMGYLLGQVRGRMAFRLSNNERFVAWATGLSPRAPLAQAALAFVSDVMLQAKDEQELEDAGAFYDSMLDLIEQFPEMGLGLVQSPSERLGTLGSQ